MMRSFATLVVCVAGLDSCDVAPGSAADLSEEVVLLQSSPGRVRMHREVTEQTFASEDDAEDDDGDDQPDTSEEVTAEDQLWPVYTSPVRGALDWKCDRSNPGLVLVANLQACQEVAAGNNHQFYSFKGRPQGDGMHKCFSSETCWSPDAVRTNRRNQWRVHGIWRQAESDAGDTDDEDEDDSAEDDDDSAEDELWPVYASPTPRPSLNWKCRRDNEGSVFVANLHECQEVALSNDHPFYSFRGNSQSDGTHRCFSSATCWFTEDRASSARLTASRNQWRTHATWRQV